MLHSVHYVRGDGSSVCCFSDGTAEHYSVIKKNLFISEYSSFSSYSTLTDFNYVTKSMGNPCRDVLKSYADIDLLVLFLHLFQSNYYQFMLFQFHRYFVCSSVLQ